MGSRRAKLTPGWREAPGRGQHTQIRNTSFAEAAPTRHIVRSAHDVPPSPQVGGIEHPRFRQHISTISSCKTHTSAISPRRSREFWQSCSASEIQRAQGMPGARRTRSLACKIKKHTSIVTTGSPEQSGIPRAMVLRLIT
jgi:hypothetical protein